MIIGHSNDQPAQNDETPTAAAAGAEVAGMHKIRSASQDSNLYLH
jgi:hypothetical protein